MRALALPRRPLDALALAAGAWTWWLAELRGLLPRRILDLANRRHQPIMVEVTAQEVVITRRPASGDVLLLRIPHAELATAGPVALKGVVSARDVVVLRLPRSEALRKTIELPLGAARTLDKILPFELERQSPLEPERIYFDHRVLRRDKAASKLFVELRIVKREAIDRAVSTCRALGLAPVSLDFGDDERSFAVPGLVAAGRAAKGRWPWRRVTAALAGLACLLAASLAYVEGARERQAASDVTARLARAKAEAQETEELRKEVDAQTTRTEFLAREKAKPLAVGLVSEITRLLPDGTWLFQLEMHGPTIRVRGYSPAASPLIAVFDGSPLFTNTRFQAPVTQGPRSGLERFDLAFDVKGEQP